MRKSWLVFGLVVVAMLAASCSKAGKAPNPKDVTLHILGGARTYEGEEAVWNDLFAQFEKEYGCKVEARWQGKWSDMPQTLQTARIAQEPVDIVYNSATLNSTMARSGILMDMTDLVKPFQGRFAEGMLDKYTLGGHVWAVPLSDSSTSTFFYNADIFKELGLSEPKTYADLLAAAKVIKEKKKIMPMIHQGKEPWYWPMWYFETFAQTSGNRSLAYTSDFLSGKRKFDGAEEKAAINAIAQFYQDGILTQESMDTDNEGMRAAFIQGKAAMYYGGTWEISPLRAAKPSFAVGIFEFPQIAAGAKPQHGGGPDNAWSIPSFAPKGHIKLIVQFLEFITRPENAQKLLDTNVALIPSIKGVKPSQDPFAQKLNTEYVPATISYLDWIWPNEVNDAITQVIPAVMTGNMTTDKAVETVQKAYDTLVKEKEYVFDWWTKWTADDWKKVAPPSIPHIEVK
jgi:raffinose/stachyose/melibiose transport system substrate-binding protein